MKSKAIILLDADAFAAVFGVAEQRELAALVEFVTPPLTAASWRAHAPLLRDVELIFAGWGTPPMDAAFLVHFPKLRAVFHAAGSVKNFATDALWDRNVRVTCAAAINAIPVAEFTLSQIIFCLKHGWQRVREVREERRFRKEDEHMPGAYGSTVGLLSLSRTGRLVAEQLRRFELKVIAYDPIVPAAEAEALGVRLRTLDEVFAESDVVSCHTPLLPETTHLLRAHHFERMKPGATFINTARGPIVRETEMIGVLKRRPDLFAVLDVTDPEPPAQDSPLLALPNVVVTPHIAGSLGPECQRLGRMMLEEARRYLAGAPLQGEVSRGQLSQVA
jgi:phosphoglycerate dehydrogenase-like enzyme